MTTVNRDYLNLLVLIVLAAGLRLYRLGDASLWVDEVLTLEMAELPWSTLWVSAYDPTPPLYYSLIKLLMGVSTAEWWLRLPSAIFGTLTVVSVYLATKQVWNSRAAFASALFLAVSTANIEYSQEGRAYALAGMCIALSFLGLAMMNTRWRDRTAEFSFTKWLKAGGLLYGAGALAALYSHNIAVFYWLAAQFFFITWWVVNFKYSRPLLGTWFCINAIILLCWLPWFYQSLQVIDTGIFSWLKQHEFQKAATIWLGINSFQTGHNLNFVVETVFILLALWGLIGLRRDVSMMVAFLALIACSSILIWTYGFIGTPIFMRRTVLWGSIFFFMLAGIGISRIPRRAGNIALAALVSLGVFDFYRYDDQFKAEFSDWRSPAMVFNEQAEINDVLLFRTQWAAPAFLHYVEGNQRARNVRGWSCEGQYSLFGRVKTTGQYSTVRWYSRHPGWDDSKLTASSIWVVENACRNKQSIAKSNEWLETHWKREQSLKFKRVNLEQWVPK